MLLQHTKYPKQTITNFIGNDCEERLIENLKKLPNTWRYATEDITYTMNSHGYRTKQFDNIDWNNSVVILGCSCVFGTGINESDTISYTLILSFVLSLCCAYCGVAFAYMRTPSVLGLNFSM